MWCVPFASLCRSLVSLSLILTLYLSSFTGVTFTIETQRYYLANTRINKLLLLYFSLWSNKALLEEAHSFTGSSLEGGHVTLRGGRLCYFLLPCVQCAVICAYVTKWGQLMIHAAASKWIKLSVSFSHVPCIRTFWGNDSGLPVMCTTYELFTCYLRIHNIWKFYVMICLPPFSYHSFLNPMLSYC